MRRQFTPLLLVPCALLVCSGWLWFRHTQRIAHDADGYMRVQVKNSHFSGAVLVSRGARVIFAKGYGFANREWQIPNTTHTKFRLASLTKQFTAVLVLRLEQQGRLRVTDPICQYIDPCPQAWASITIHHLLSQTSGIHNYSDAADFPANKRIAQTHEQIAARFREEALEFKPGERMAYSNSNYFLLGMIVEKVSGKSYGDLLAAEITRPLGMADSGTVDSADILLQRAAGYWAAPAGQVRNADYADESWSFASGSIYSTVEDLEKWNRALDGDKVLPQTILKRMWSPVKGDYGYGWFVPAVSAATLKRRVVFHSGRMDGFVSCMSRFPEQKLVVVVLSNHVMVKHACSIATGLAAIAFGEKEAIRKDDVEVSIDPAILQRYVGEYRASGDLSITVSSESGRLFVEATGLSKLEIYPASETEFFFKAFDTQIDFALGPDGKADQLTAHIPMRDDISAVRVH